VIRPGRILLNATTIVSAALFLVFLALRIVGAEVYVGSNPQLFIVSRSGLLDVGIAQNMVTIPLLIPVIITILLPIHWFHGWCTAREARRGAERLRSLCAACGYDLRATPGRCPECGAVNANANEGERKSNRSDA
jgi:hypothetical protein